MVRTRAPRRIIRTSGRVERRLRIRGILIIAELRCSYCGIISEKIAWRTRRMNEIAFGALECECETGEKEDV